MGHKVITIKKPRRIGAKALASFHLRKNGLAKYIKIVLIFKEKYYYPAEKSPHDQLVTLVERMLELNKRLHGGTLTDHERNIVKRQIDTTDRDIDALVYQLYGLTDEEIRVVEGGSLNHGLGGLIGLHGFSNPRNPKIREIP